MDRIPIVNIIVGREDNKIIILKRRFYPKNKIDLLGGYVEEGEAIEDAAVREAKEESGFDIELVHKLGKYDYFDRGEKRSHVFIGRVIGGKLTSSKEGRPFWINPSQIKPEELAFPQVHARVLKEYLDFEAMRSNS